MRCGRRLSELIGVLVVFSVLLSGSPALTQLVPQAAARRDGCGCSSSCPCRKGAGHRCMCKAARTGPGLEQACECGRHAGKATVPAASGDWLHPQEIAFHISFRSVPVVPEQGRAPVWHPIDPRLHPS